MERLIFWTGSFRKLLFSRTVKLVVISTSCQHFLSAHLTMSALEPQRFMSYSALGQKLDKGAILQARALANVDRHQQA
jgi:hypothetical protein